MVSQTSVRKILTLPLDGTLLIHVYIGFFGFLKVTHSVGNTVFKLFLIVVDI